MPLPPPSPEYKAAEKRAAEFGEFSVLVWGPGAKQPAPLFEKRQRVREHLQNVLGKKEAVQFTEELNHDTSFQQLAEKEGNKEAQRQQALIFDAVVLLVISEGAYAEAIRFESELKGKSIIFMAPEYEQRFHEHGAVHMLLEFSKREPVDHQQLLECRTIRGKAEEFILGLRDFKREQKGSTEPQGKP